MQSRLGRLIPDLRGAPAVATIAVICAAVFAAQAVAPRIQITAGLSLDRIFPYVFGIYFPFLAKGAFWQPVTYIFLQDWRATFVPAVAIPISLLGAFILSSPVIVAFASYGYGYESKSSSAISPLRIIVCLAIGLIVALIVTSIMKSKLKSVHWDNYADNYIESNSFKLYIDNDVFLYDKVEKTRISNSDDDD